MKDSKIDLGERKCIPCSGKEEPLKREEINKLHGQINNGWQVVDDKKLRKNYPFENFKRGMVFVNDIALLADDEQHHPDVCIHYKNVDRKSVV